MNEKCTRYIVPDFIGKESEKLSNFLKATQLEMAELSLKLRSNWFQSLNSQSRGKEGRKGGPSNFCPKYLSLGEIIEEYLHYLLETLLHC